MEYYQIPFSALELFKNREFRKCEDLRRSIECNIELILRTSFGESTFDPTFGCSIWENDFDCMISPDQWNAKLAQSIKRSIQLHEPRLGNLVVTTNIIEDEVKQQYNNNLVSRMKRRIDVRVRGNMVLTNEEFDGVAKLYVSPISID